MPRNVDGNYSLPAGTLVNSGDTILVSQHNPAMNDIATAIGNSLDRNGTGGMRAALNMGGNPVQNVGTGSNDSDVATVAQVSAVGVPVGTVIDFAGPIAPAGYLFCAGQAISRETYADLFIQIGVYYGPGDGSTTFNIPDCRGRVSAGQDNMNGVAAGRLTEFAATSVGAVGGVDKVILTEGQIPSHTHTASAEAAGSHIHGIPGREGSDTSGPFVGGASTGANSKETDINGEHTHVITVSSTGGGLSHSNVQPTIIFGKAIKAVK